MLTFLQHKKKKITLNVPHATPQDGALVDAERHEDPVLAELLHRSREETVLL